MIKLVKVQIRVTFKPVQNPFNAITKKCIVSQDLLFHLILNHHFVSLAAALELAFTNFIERVTMHFFHNPLQEIYFRILLKWDS